MDVFVLVLICNAPANKDPHYLANRLASNRLSSYVPTNRLVSDSLINRLGHHVSANDDIHYSANRQASHAPTNRLGSYVPTNWAFNTHPLTDWVPKPGLLNWLFMRQLN